MIYPYYVPEIIGVEGESLQRIEDCVSVQWARAFNTDGSATVVIPNTYDRSLFRLHTRMKLLRYGYGGKPSVVGDTVWFLKKIDNDISEGLMTLNFVDAFAMLGTRIVAYTAQTPFADKTLEEYELITYNNSLRLDTMMLDYMRENFGADALENERIHSGIAIEGDRNMGPYGEKQAAWQQMDSVLQDLARQSAASGFNLYYDLLPIDGGQFQFRIWSRVRGTDRGSKSAQPLVLNDKDGFLDEIHEVEDYSEMATVCYALGFDSGPSQVWQRVTSPLWVHRDPFSRIEMTLNATDSDIPSVLRAEARAALNGARPRRIITAKVAENSGLEYDKDLSYGDLLVIEVGGRNVDVALDAASGTWDEEGEKLDLRLTGEELIMALIDGGPEDPGVPLPGTVNTRPVANAGDDQVVAFGDPVMLGGSGVDDGLPDPPGALTYAWSMVSGPGVAVFDDAASASTEVTLPVPGTYVFRLTVSDGELFDEDEVTISPTPFVPEPPSPDIIRSSMERVGAMSEYHWYRTADFQTRDIEGGPTWTRHDVATSSAEKIRSFVVNPFSVGYLTGTGEVNAFVAMLDKIVRVTDLFGTVGRTTLLTFPTAINDSTHWRSIAASFGRYFEADADNPWLICISYYADAAGHTGTWCTRSLDGGQTWSAEVQVSPHYDTSLSVAQPIAVYTSPRTPGFAMCFAYITTAAPAVADIFISYDWGASWTAANEIVEDPAEPWPIITPPGGGGGGGGGGLVSHSVATCNEEFFDETRTLTITGAANVARMRVLISYAKFARKDNYPSSFAGALHLATSGGISGNTIDSGQSGSGEKNDPTTGFVLVDYEGDFDGGWIEVGAHVGVNGIGAGNCVESSMIVFAQVVEVELEDGHTYEPPVIPIIGTEHGQGGSLHVPWANNEAELLAYRGSVNRTADRLLTTRAVAGPSDEPISPNDGTRDYGVYHGLFGIRAHDSLNSYMLMGGRGNDTSSGATDDLVGLYLSKSGGANWDELLAPVDESNAFYGLQAAFSSTNPEVYYAWGAYTGSALKAIYYRRQGSVSLDSREGNLATLEDGDYGGAIAFLGIAGGPPDDEPPAPEGDESVYANPQYFYGDMKGVIAWDATDVVRTLDIQEPSTVWARVDTGISGTIIDGKWVVIDDDSLGMWLLTTAGVFWCADIMATTPSWSNVLPIATVQAADAAPVTGQLAVQFQSMGVYDLEPGYCIVATAPVDDAVNPSGYQHAYFWHTHDYGQNWTQVDMNMFTFTSGSVTRCYYNCGHFGLDVFRKAPGTIWCVRTTSRTGTSTGDTAVFKSEDLGHTWTKEFSYGSWSAPQNEGALLAPWPYLNSPTYVSRATTSSSTPSMRVSVDGWATTTLITPPANHAAGYGNNNVIQRVNRRGTDENHLIGVMLQTSPLSSGGPLMESYDQGLNWSTLVSGASNDHTTPKEWPLDPFQWLYIRNSASASPQVSITLDNFANIESREGNLNSVLSGGAWASGAGGGFALPRVGTNA